MPPFAICSSKTCPYWFGLREKKEERTALPPESCPACNGVVIFRCPLCSSSLLEKPSGEEPRCANCKARLRQSALWVRERSS